MVGQNAWLFHYLIVRRFVLEIPNTTTWIVLDMNEFPVMIQGIKDFELSIVHSINLRTLNRIDSKIIPLHKKYSVVRG